MSKLAGQRCRRVSDLPNQKVKEPKHFRKFLDVSDFTVKAPIEKLLPDTMV